MTVNVNPVGNQAPTANAGPDQTVNSGATVNLNGTGSSDPDGTIASYAWTQTGGANVTLTGANTATPSFTAPTGPATLTFMLTVTDNNGATGTDSVTVNVNPPVVQGIDAAGDVIVHGQVKGSRHGCEHGWWHGWRHSWRHGWRHGSKHGSEHGSKHGCSDHGSTRSKVYLFRVSNLGDTRITVDPNTDIVGVVNVNGTPNGSVTSLTGTKTIKPGHSRVFPLRWTVDGKLDVGDTVEFTACVNLAGDTDTTNNCDSETLTAR